MRIFKVLRKRRDVRFAGQQRTISGNHHKVLIEAHGKARYIARGDCGVGRVVYAVITS